MVLPRLTVRDFFRGGDIHCHAIQFARIEAKVVINIL